MPKKKGKVYVPKPPPEEPKKPELKKPEPVAAKKPAPEVKAPVPKTEVPLVIQVPKKAETKVVDPNVCPNCGFSKSDFVTRWNGLRDDLKRQSTNRATGFRVLCPKCFKPVAPY